MNKNMSFSVSGQRIELTDAAMLVAGTVNEYTARFTFDESWDGYQRTAVFSCGDISREQLLTDDACTVPWEVLVSNGYLRVGVYGTKDGSRLPTIWAARRLFVNTGAGPTQESEDPSPTLVEQLLGRMGDLATLKTEDKSSLVAAINEVWSSGGSGGASVTDAAINEDGHLIITLSTGTTIDAGYAVGPAGAAGAAGKDGQDGAPGKDGAAGAPGKDGVGIQSVDQTTTSTDDGGTNIITVTKSDGSSSTFQVRNGSKGSTGPAGADGAPGKDGLGVPVATAEDAGKVLTVTEAGVPGWMTTIHGLQFKKIMSITVPDDGEEIVLIDLPLPPKARMAFVIANTNTLDAFNTSVRFSVKNGKFDIATYHINMQLSHRRALFNVILYDDIQFLSASSANSSFDAAFPGLDRYGDYASFFGSVDNKFSIFIKGASSTQNQNFLPGSTFDLYAIYEE